jgi:hypothetical protein
MTISTSKLESTLVSMAGTLIYLREMASVLASKPIVPKAVASDMPATLGELAVLGVQFEAARRAAAADAQPFLDDWLTRVGLHVGGVFDAKTARRHAPGDPLRITGGVERVALLAVPIAGVRVVDVTLIGAELHVPRLGIVRSVDEIPVRDQADQNLCALRDVKTVDPVTGASRIALHVRIPLKTDDRTAWARAGNLDML